MTALDPELLQSRSWIEEEDVTWWILIGSTS